MQQLEELTSIIERLSVADTFEKTSELLIEWARGYTSCQAGTLRLLVDDDGKSWLGTCATTGATDSFARDEALIAASECICGRVTRGSTDATLPFFTSGGSFRWGRMATFDQEFSAGQTGKMRGRCLTERSQSVAIFPLKARGKIVGSLHLADPRPGLFAESVPVIESVCRLAGDILLRHSTRDRERELLDRIQSALMPSLPARIDGLTIGVSFDSATDMALLGGDFYDVLDLGKAGVFILVGDVSGKGLEAAGIAARTRFALEAQARESQDPARLMAAANAILIEQLQPERFVTAAACLLPPGGGMAKVCLAGHPAPLHFKRDGGSEVSAPHNPPLGVFDDARYCEHDVLISPGDLLIIYTDGVADSRRGRVEFGVGGIFEAVDSVPGRDPGEIATAVCAASSRFHDSSSPADDQLVLAVRLD